MKLKKVTPQPPSKRNTWILLATGAAIVAGIAARNSLESGYKKVKDKEPPGDPSHTGTGWGSALVWAALTGLVVELSRLLAREGTAQAWERVTGKQPPRD